jgi:alpha-beta hydrolase superfamily lysophospholipase
MARARSICFEIKTPDGLRLLGRRWPVDPSQRRGRALIVHGVGEHSGRYDEVANAMTSLGVEVVSYDQRGFGESEGTRGEIPRTDTLVTDAAMVFDLVRREAPRDPPPFLIAHSMGGTIAAFAVAERRIAPRGLALSSPAIAPRVSAIEEQALRLLLRFAPDAPLDSRIKPEQVTRDLNEQQKIKNDKKRMHTTVTPKLVVSILDQGRSALEAAGRIPVPTLLLVAGTDLIVDPDVTLQFFARIPANLSTLHQYPKLFHEVFNELPADRQRVFKDFDRWLRRQLGLPLSRRSRSRSAS